MDWEELLDITPGMFLALIKRQRYRDATWIATYANFKRGKDQPAITPEDLLPRKRKRQGMGPEVFRAFEKAFTDG